MSADVDDVSVRGDAELLLRAADAAHLQRLPHDLERILLRFARGCDGHSFIAVLSATLASVCLGDALGALASDSGQVLTPG